MQKIYPVFDWTIASQRHSPQRIKFLREHFAKNISEAEYISAMQSIRKFSKDPKRYKPSSLRNEYQYLKNWFGFFSK